MLHVCMPKVFRLSEQYLIRAEARANQDNMGGASKDLSDLRKARFQGGNGANLGDQTKLAGYYPKKNVYASSIWKVSVCKT